MKKYVGGMCGWSRNSSLWWLFNFFNCQFVIFNPSSINPATWYICTCMYVCMSVFNSLSCYTTPIATPPCIQSDGQTALYAAVANQHKDVVKILLEHNADVTTVYPKVHSCIV